MCLCPLDLSHSVDNSITLILITYEWDSIFGEQVGMRNRFYKHMVQNLKFKKSVDFQFRSDT